MSSVVLTQEAREAMAGQLRTMGVDGMKIRVLDVLSVPRVSRIARLFGRKQPAGKGIVRLQLEFYKGDHAFYVVEAGNLFEGETFDTMAPVNLEIIVSG